jgi:hypothetical protein
MGLIYVFPVSSEETDFVVRKDESLILKSYGLPYIFWLYAFCIIVVIGFMFFAIKEPVLKLISLGDQTDAFLGYSLLAMIGLSPLVILGYFFYEKRLIRFKEKLSIEHRIFGLKLLSKVYELKGPDELLIEPYLDSPNIARMNRSPENAGFQNKGYFVLSLLKGEKKITLDRHSRKADLEKLKILLTQ